MLHTFQTKIQNFLPSDLSHNPDDEVRQAWKGALQEAGGSALVVGKFLSEIFDQITLYFDASAYVLRKAAINAIEVLQQF